MKFPTAATDGGLAFPGSRMEQNPLKDHVLEQMVRVDYPGMSLRDYFAAKAMQGLISHYGDDGEKIGLIAYAIADLMLTARAEKEK